MNKPIEELIQRLKEQDYKYYGCELSRGEAELVISALEKQITKKPKVMETTLVGEKFWWYCGHCGASRHTNSKSNYCSYCGGKVNWNEAES